jgi:hypothetical protein
MSRVEGGTVPVSRLGHPWQGAGVGAGVYASAAPNKLHVRYMRVAMLPAYRLPYRDTIDVGLSFVLFRTGTGTGTGTGIVSSII